MTLTPAGILAPKEGTMRAALLSTILVLAATPAAAQVRDFSCVGAERLEDDVFAIPFARGSAALGDAARSPLAAAAELARQQPERMICVLGHAGEEGGAQRSLRLAAQRAGAVALALAERGVERDRIRSEARHASFARRSAVPDAPMVTIVILPEP